MGDWAITIQGVGAHHNHLHTDDANRMARRFVESLKAAGHTITRADFTHGGKEDLCDPDQAHSDDRGDGCHQPAGCTAREAASLASARKG
jgi:hypothetical protein